MKINRFKILVFISLGFLIYFLITKDIFNIPRVYSFRNLLLAEILIFGCFIIESLMWKRVLKPDLDISKQDAIVSVGLSVFTKYIPGKVLVILGRAEYIRKKYGYPIKVLINRSFHAQFLAIFAAIVVGSCSVFLFEDARKYFVFIVAGLLLIGTVVFTSFTHKTIEKVFKRVLKKTVVLPNLERREAVSALPLFLLYWVVLSIGFYFFVSAFTPVAPPLLTGFIFPLGVVFGIVVIISPGGIGFREGLLTGMLHLAGVEIGFATSIALISRLWFLSGESFLFSTAFLLDQFQNRGK